MKKIGMFLACLGFLIGACVKRPLQEEIGIINYVKQDGQQVLRVSLKEMNFHFTSPLETKSDLGGLITECGVANIRCVDLGGYILAFPVHDPIPNRWKIGQYDFSITARADRGKNAVYLVRVSAKSDTYMYFSYSAVGGVESISLQREGTPPDMVKTYFLAGEAGLLARS